MLFFCLNFGLSGRIKCTRTYLRTFAYLPKEVYHHDGDGRLKMQAKMQSYTEFFFAFSFLWKNIIFGLWERIQAQIIGLARLAWSTVSALYKKCTRYYYIVVWVRNEVADGIIVANSGKVFQLWVTTIFVTKKATTNWTYYNIMLVPHTSAKKKRIHSNNL